MKVETNKLARRKKHVGRNLLTLLMRVACLLVLFTSAAGASTRNLSSKSLANLTGVLATEERVLQQDVDLADLLQGRIVGGSRVASGDYRFFTRVDRNLKLHCGGTLVAPDAVLTAAHCGTQGLSVIVNGYDDSDSTQPLPFNQHFREVIETWVHPYYVPATYYNDMMLLKLNESVPIPFVELNRATDLPLDGTNVTVMGLGALYEGANINGGYPSTLQQVEVGVTDHSFCNNAYEGVGLFPILDSTMVCAGVRTGIPKDACQGDSGGPLIDQRGIQVGVVSFGLGCARQAFPGMFTLL